MATPSDTPFEFTVLSQLIERDLRLFFPVIQKPLVTVLIPCYNQYRYTAQCLLSIGMRTENIPYEILIADDNSTDETVNVERHFPNVRVIKNQTENHGFLPNVNHAAQFARGKYLVLLNNDTVVCSNWLNELIAGMEEHSDIGISGGCVLGEDSAWLGNLILPERGSIALGPISFHNRPPHFVDCDWVEGSLLAIRRDLWNELHGFNPVFSPGYWEDVELCLRVKATKGLRCVCNVKSRYFHFGSRTFSSQEKQEKKKKNRGILMEMYHDYFSQREETARRKYPEENLESALVRTFFAPLWNSQM